MKQEKKLENLDVLEKESTENIAVNSLNDYSPNDLTNKWELLHQVTWMILHSRI